MIYHPRLRVFSTLTSHRILYGTLKEIGKCRVPLHRRKTEESKSLEHKQMSDVCDRYLTTAKITVEDQYVSLCSDINKTIQCEGWRVEQITFITGARSVNK